MHRRSFFGALAAGVAGAVAVSAGRRSADFAELVVAEPLDFGSTIDITRPDRFNVKTMAPTGAPESGAFLFTDPETGKAMLWAAGASAPVPASFDV